MTKTILITGGAGFIGSNFLHYFQGKHPQYKLVVLDLLTYAGNLENLRGLSTANYQFVKGSIYDKDLVTGLFAQHDFDGVIHFAAESHVDNSIVNPDEFIFTNIVGTFTLLNIAKNHWMEAPFKFRPGKETARFLHISTDEVYGSLGPEGLFTETTAYAPNSPYSASKASSDLLVRSYFHTYGMSVVTTNCSNNYGPRQHAEKLIPTIIRKALSWEKIPVYGDGLNIRDWLFVDDHCEAIDVVFHRGRLGETYNVGGDSEKTNIDVVRTICAKLDKKSPHKNGSYSALITYVKDRPGHDRRYAIDASKLKGELGWSPGQTFAQGIDLTIDWYLSAAGKLR